MNDIAIASGVIYRGEDGEIKCVIHSVLCNDIQHDGFDGLDEEEFLEQLEYPEDLVADREFIALVNLEFIEVASSVWDLITEPYEPEVVYKIRAIDSPKDFFKYYAELM